MAEASRDQNFVPTILGVSSTDGTTPVKVYADPTTHRLLVDIAGGVTSVSVVTANGLAGTVATATTTPAITLSTTITGILKGNGTAISAASDGSDYLSSTTGITVSQGTPQTLGTTSNRLTKLWATDITCTNVIAGSITGNAATVSNATLTTALTVNGGTLTLTANAANTSVLTIGAGAVSVSGSNTGDQTTISGNAGSATVLATPRAIYGNNFDGSAALTQIIASTYGGTGNGFTKFTGPTTAEKTFTLPDSSATLLYSGGALGTPSSGTLTNCTFPTLNQNTTGTAAGLSATLVPSKGGTGVANNDSSTITISGNYGTTFTVSGTTSVTLPTSGTLAISSSAQTFTGTQTFSQIVTTNNAITASGNAATVPITSRISTVTNNSAATLTITMTTTSAVDGQLVMVRILDATAVAQTISWVNTENSTILAPTTSNGSTTLPLTVGFQYNANTSKFRCIAVS